MPFPFTGHAVLGKSTCAVAIVDAFLDDPTKPVDARGAAQITLAFEVGQESCNAALRRGRCYPDG